MNQRAATVVALFVRPPIPGKVKTRLASAIGAEGACLLYEAMVADILGQIRASGLAFHLFHDGVDSEGLPGNWLEGAVKIWPQRGNDIGERMASAFADCFATGIERVILVGSDLPDLDAGVLLRAAKTLDSSDAVLNPVADGGYCLIGLRRERFRPEVFSEIPWSTGHVMARTLRRIETCGLTVAMLPELKDIDTVDDLRIYRQRPSTTALATNRVLGELLG